jgi:hypothetical protein
MTETKKCFLFDFDILFLLLEKIIDSRMIVGNVYISPKVLTPILKLQATNKVLMNQFDEYLEIIYAKMLPVHIPAEVKKHSEELYQVVYMYSSCLKSTDMPQIDIQQCIPSASLYEKGWFSTWLNSFKLKISKEAKYLCLSFRSSIGNEIVTKRQLWKVRKITHSKILKSLPGTFKRVQQYDVLLTSVDSERTTDENFETESIPNQMILQNIPLSNLKAKDLVMAHYRNICGNCNSALTSYHSDSSCPAMRNLCNICFRENTISITHAYNMFKERNHLSLVLRCFDFFEKKGHKGIVRMNKLRMVELTKKKWDDLVKNRNKKYDNDHIY